MTRDVGTRTTLRARRLNHALALATAAVAALTFVAGAIAYGIAKGDIR